MKETEVSSELVTPGDVLGDATEELKAGRGAYVNDTTVFIICLNPPKNQVLAFVLQRITCWHMNYRVYYQVIFDVVKLEET
ncbi:unnamed protein product [Arabis nemorensis]|uniref:Exosome complex component N-terminal domain-containing protein n=1 Tax=Arabis nemorensis TaxID=586526 RepID=A0A565AW91_9BRAS|nr:unnamed protein product [Arabis nemorensis]